LDEATVFAHDLIPGKCIVTHIVLVVFRDFLGRVADNRLQRKRIVDFVFPHPIDLVAFHDPNKLAVVGGVRFDTHTEFFVSLQFELA